MEMFLIFAVFAIGYILWDQHLNEQGVQKQILQLQINNDRLNREVAELQRKSYETSNSRT